MEREIIIKNRSGLHARPAAKLVAFAKGFAEKITLSKGEKSAPATSLLAILGLGISQGDKVKVAVEGEEAEQVLDQFAQFAEQLAQEEAR
ncbi:phosphocarrier protein HPr [Peptococcaceae bacterium CEB3]|nr:phosphocarrier protein HPr [Peptococcaceae bacterium CEB3]